MTTLEKTTDGAFVRGAVPEQAGRNEWAIISRKQH